MQSLPIADHTVRRPPFKSLRGAILRFLLGTSRPQAATPSTGRKVYDTGVREYGERFTTGREGADSVFPGSDQSSAACSD